MEERSRPQGFRSQAEKPPPMNRTERSRARAAAEDDNFTIHKGKKDITQPLVPDPLSRKARFYNPHFSHGKKSLVFQLKSGELRDKMRALEEADKAKEAPTTSSDFEKAFQGTVHSDSKPRSTPRDSRSGGNSRAQGEYRTARYPREDRERTSFRDQDRNQGSRNSDREFRPRRPERDDRPPRGDGEFQPRSADGGDRPRFEPKEDSIESTDKEDRPSFTKVDRPDFSDRADRPRYGDREDRPRYQNREDRPPFSGRGDRRDDRPSSSPWLNESQTRTKELRRSGFARRTGAEQQPLSIPHTTAASQFLYGRSVVEAALSAKRRQLYKLYIYAGANRQNPEEIASIEALAKRRRLECRFLGPDQLPLLDKMAGDRPHNGYVLEASPLPQLPLTSLGPMAEEEGKPGFQVNLAHQSAEDAAVNGTDSFVPVAKSTHKPLVIVLDQILDPGNLGAILRSANFLGATAVAITKRNTATLTPVALKASAGASEAVTIFSVDNLASFLTDSKENGWKVYAAVPPTSATRRREVTIHEVEERDPLSKDPSILLLGSEGEGLSKQLRAKADYEVNIPNMSESNLVDSLNVSVATGLLCSAFLKGKTKSEFSIVAEKEDEVALF